MMRNHTFEHGHRIGVKRPSEKNWLIRYGEGEDNRQPVFAFDEASARVWTQVETYKIKAELDRAQKVVDEPERGGSTRRCGWSRQRARRSQNCPRDPHMAPSSVVGDKRYRFDFIKILITLSPCPPFSYV